ncbi:NAD-dependent epimerase/dehydratase family protein [Devosia sp.]|uniref:NAD-dependent epimerase/dehydratase family protein n=1 Tax=Devosia sp. TaxID=1871048 RepID=UPI002F186379
MTRGKVTILGSNGHIGHRAARAFVAAGWDVTGFGRANRAPVAGMHFVAGDADSLADLRRAIGDSEIVVNALNLAYDKWDNGRLEALMGRVVEAMGSAGRTLLFPGNIYNYAPAERVLTPDTVPLPPTPRGAIRQRVENMLRAAAGRGDIQAVILRAGDFFGPDSSGDWFDQVLLREAGKGKVAIPGRPGIGHAWAYLPDLARAFEKLAWHRRELAGFENFHFAGHFLTPEQLGTAVAAAGPAGLRVGRFPWLLITLMGLVNPVMREVGKMGYLWEHPMELRDARLEAILGPDFVTPLDVAMAATLAPYFPTAAQAA